MQDVSLLFSGLNTKLQQTHAVRCLVAVWNTMCGCKAESKTMRSPRVQIIRLSTKHRIGAAQKKPSTAVCSIVSRLRPFSTESSKCHWAKIRKRLLHAGEEKLQLHVRQAGQNCVLANVRLLAALFHGI